MRLFWCGIFLAAALPALAAPGDDEAAIRQRFVDWTAAFNARDAAAACDLFAPDLRYAIPEQVDGTQAMMCGNLARILARDDLRLHYEEPAVHEILVAGDIAVVRLTWTLTTAAAKGTETTTEEGIDIFRRQPDGRWSIERFLAFTPVPSRLPQQP
jgi:ketosteroid isomerase-like protein